MGYKGQLTVREKHNMATKCFWGEIEQMIAQTWKYYNY